MEAIRCPLADEWIKYIYTMECYSAVEHIWVSSNEVDEIGACYTEWSKKEKHQYHILTHIYMGFRKMVTMTLYVRQQKRHKCKEQIFGFCGRRWGWDDLKEYWNMYIMWNRWSVQLQYMKQGTQSRGAGTTQRDGMGREVGRGFRMGRHMCTWGWFMSMYGKKKIPQQYCKVVSN